MYNMVSYEKSRSFKKIACYRSQKYTEYFRMNTLRILINLQKYTLIIRAHNRNKANVNL